MNAIMLSLFLILTGRSRQTDVRPPDFVKQIETVDRMDLIQRLMTLYLKDHKSDPRSIDELMRVFDMPATAEVDGWGRPFFYYTNGHDFILASFGRSGVPQAQTADPGGVSTQRNFDTNLVMINDKWAQTPMDVDR
jgi:hypothetical protein